MWEAVLGPTAWRQWPGGYLRKRLERFRGKVVTALCLVYRAAVGRVCSRLNERKWTGRYSMNWRSIRWWVSKLVTPACDPRKFLLSSRPQYLPVYCGAPEQPKVLWQIEMHLAARRWECKGLFFPIRRSSEGDRCLSWLSGSRELGLLLASLQFSWLPHHGFRREAAPSTLSPLPQSERFPCMPATPLTFVLTDLVTWWITCLSQLPRMLGKWGPGHCCEGEEKGMHMGLLSTGSQGCKPLIQAPKVSGVQRHCYPPTALPATVEAERTRPGFETSLQHWLFVGPWESPCMSETSRLQQDGIWDPAPPQGSRALCSHTAPHSPKGSAFGPKLGLQLCSCHFETLTDFRTSACIFILHLVLIIS